MPPSRELKVDLDDDILIRVVKELELKEAITVHVSRNTSGRIHGIWESSNRTLVIYPGVQLLQGSGLRACQLELTITTLHELRHAHQDDNWHAERRARDNKRPYALRESERDAEEWAQANARIFAGLVRVRTKTPRSVLGRLAKAETTVR